MSALSFLFDWSGRTGRVTFAVVAGLFVAAVLWLVVSWWTGVFDGATPGAHWPLLAVGLLFLPFHACFVRRLHDARLSRRHYLVLFIPVVGFYVVGLLATRPPVRSFEPTPSLARQTAVALTTLGAVVLCASAYLALHRVAGVDMKPGILPGDVVVVARPRATGPMPGDLVVLRTRDAGRPVLRRVAAGPGARVEMRAGQLIVDGVAVGLSEDGRFTEIYGPQGPGRVLPYCTNAPVGEGGICEKSLQVESLPNGHAHRILDTRASPLDTVGEILVPEGHVFVLGDNRDNATDSRVSASARGLGPVPLEMVIGRANRVLFSASGPALAQFWLWRPGRYLAGLE